MSQKLMVPFLTLMVATLWSSWLGAQGTGEPRPKVAGVMKLTLQSRQQDNQGNWKLATKEVEWKVRETAVIVIDMWDDHYCKLAAQRVGVMAPRMNRVLSEARSHGVLIIHAPSGCMDLYEGLPGRVRVKSAAKAKLPTQLAINKWCYLDPKKEPELPVDTTKSSCDDPVVGLAVRRFSKQHPALDIIGYDGISDNGEEIHNYFTQEGIKNVVIMGVHTNMCVLGRPFGIRQQTYLGNQVVLARDLTDAMYDPRQPPYVSHTRGTELVIEHIEKYWCPTVLGNDLVRVVPGSAGP